MKKRISEEELAEIREIEKLSRENKDNIVDYSKELSKVVDFVECPKCKYKNIMGATKCAKCNCEINKKTKSCPKCAKRNDINAIKCECGYDFKKQKDVGMSFIITILIILFGIFLGINYFGIINIKSKYISMGIGGFGLVFLVMSYMIYSNKNKLPLDADMKIRENYSLGRTIGKIFIFIAFAAALVGLGYFYYKNR